MLSHAAAGGRTAAARPCSRDATRRGTAGAGREGEGAARETRERIEMPRRRRYRVGVPLPNHQVGAADVAPHEAPVPCGKRGKKRKEMRLGRKRGKEESW